MHTPGPWTMEDRAYVWAVTDGQGQEIVMLGKPQVYQGVPCGSVCSQGRSQDEVAANARLIAAAPDLLEALERARVALTYYREEMDRDNPGKNKTYPFGVDCEEEARAALAKAKGE